jgi:hypothetical protein
MDMKTYVLPAGTVSADGDGIRIHFSVRFGSGTGNPTYRLKFNGINIITIAETTQPKEANGWLQVYQTGADAAIVYAQWTETATDNGAGTVKVRNNFTGVGATPWSTNTTIKTTYQNSAAGNAGVFDRHLQIVFYPA